MHFYRSVSANHMLRLSMLLCKKTGWQEFLITVSKPSLCSLQLIHVCNSKTLPWRSLSHLPTHPQLSVFCMNHLLHLPLLGMLGTLATDFPWKSRIIIMTTMIKITVAANAHCHVLHTLDLFFSSKSSSAVKQLCWEPLCWQPPWSLRWRICFYVFETCMLTRHCQQRTLDKGRMPMVMLLFMKPYAQQWKWAVLRPDIISFDMLHLSWVVSFPQCQHWRLCGSFHLHHRPE